MAHEGRKLDSWKEIAGYLNRSVATVQRWEREEGLPVHRITHRVRGSVYAYAVEIEGWLETRAQREAAEPPVAVEARIPFENRESRGVTVVSASQQNVRTVGLAIVSLMAVGLVWTGWFRIQANTPGPAREPLATVAFTDFPGVEQNPTFSPDGSEIAFSWNGEESAGYDIYLRSVTDGALRRLTSHPLHDKAPRWSPKGDQIAFIRENVLGSKDVMLLDLATGAETFVVTLRYPQRYGVFLDWTSDGRSLLFNRRDSPDKPLHVERMDLGTREVTALSHPSGNLGDLYFAISPDNQSLALARCESTSSCDLYVQEFRAGRLRRLTADHLFIEGVCWTPDGKEIVFASARGGFRELWRIPAAGEAGLTTPRVITALGGNVLHPDVGRTEDPNRFRVAYQWISTDVGIWRTGANWPAAPGSQVQVVAGPSSRINVAVSPMEDSIAYVSKQSGFSEIWIREFGQGISRQLTRLARPPTTAPSWDGDGKRLVFSSAGDIWVVGTEGLPPEQITNTPWTEDRPRFARDGDRLYFVSQQSGAPNLWMLELDNAIDQRLVAAGEVYDFALDSGGRNIYFTRFRDLPTGLWRVSSTGGNEELVQEGVRGGCWTLKGDSVYFLDFRDNSMSRHLPRDVIGLELSSGALRKVGTIPRTGDPNLLLGFDYEASTGRFYWSERDGSVADIWMDDLK